MSVSMHCQILQTLTFFVLGYVAGNSKPVCRWYLGRHNQTSDARGLRVTFSRAAADPTLCSRSLVEQRHLASGLDTHGTDEGNTNNVAVVALTDRLLVRKTLLLEVLGNLSASPGQPTDVRLCSRACTSYRRDLGSVPPTEEHHLPLSAPPRTADIDQMGTSMMDDSVQIHIRSVRIYTERQAYAAGANISFLAVTEEPDPLQFCWWFGDSETVTTASRRIIKSFLRPDRYDVSVHVSNGQGCAVSEVYQVLVQRAVQIRALQHSPTTLLNTTLQLSCFATAADGLTYLWDFGDGVQRFGHRTVHHVYNRTGEFVVEVTVSNLVSSASLHGHVFVLSEPCQPPSVRNMGPNRIQVWRYQPVRLSVTYETPIQCRVSQGLPGSPRVSQGLLYSWTLYDQGGQQLHIPLTETNRQYLHLPKYFLQYGIYKVLAKVQVAGSIVYSNYSVLVEVRPSLPVSTISGATRLFASRHDSSAVITLDGQESHDPDFPDNVLSYSWKCTPVNAAKSLCFTDPVDTSCAVLVFSVSILTTGCDLFKFTLTVQSGGGSASSHVFITVRSKPSSIVQVSCRECRGNSVDWSERLSFTAACGSCPGNVSYSWRLYLVNASSRAVPGVPFCGSVERLSPSNLEGAAFFSQHPGEEALAPALPVEHPASAAAYLDTTAASSLSSEALMNNEEIPALQLPLIGKKASLRTLPRGEGSPMSPSRGERSMEHQGLSDLGSATDSDLDYEDFYSGIEEADPGEPLGRPTGPYSLDDVIQPSDVHEGDNVVGASSLGQVELEKTLLDLPRELIQPGLLEAFTSTGSSSSVIAFKPAMLKPRALYMLEVSASVPAGSQWALQGKAQLFLPTRAALEGVACQVQPSSGLEIHTLFSIFCTTGQQDLVYEYSFSVGNSSQTRLYEGRDYQHYFHLPCGDSYNDYKVTIFIKIGDRFGAVTTPCSVNIKVLPSFQRTLSPHSNPDEELFVYGLGNLTNLMQTQNDRNILNYISLLNGVLNRLSLDPQSSIKLQTRVRATLISACCQVTVTSQDLLFDVLHTVSDLMKVSNQVTFGSAKLVTERMRDLSSLHKSHLPYTVLDVGVVEALVLVLSRVLDVATPSSTLGIRLTQDALHTASEVLLMYIQAGKDMKCSVNSTFMKMTAWHHGSCPTAVKTINGTTFYIPNVLEMDIKRGSSDVEQTPCFITQLVSYRRNPYHWDSSPKQLIGDVADMRVYNCSTRREINVRRLSAPVVIEFLKHEQTSGDISFSLMQSEVNTHEFSISSELLHKALQITVEFRRPPGRTFPVLLLFRIHKRPTPTVYNVQTVYRWKGQTAQIFLPPLSLKGSGSGYLMLLNADHSKSSRNRYISKALNYTLRLQAIQCLSWDGSREWSPRDCSVLHGLSSSKVNCSCSHLSSFTVSRQTIPSTHSTANITEFISVSPCLLPWVVMAVSMVIYAVLLVFGREADSRTEQSSRPLPLPDNKPTDHFLYTITTFTGLRSANSMTAKVYIVLYGEHGVSQTKEISSPDLKLFTPNSRNTFILSAPQSLGQVWQIHLWHDCGGASPSWFLSHVLVRDMVEGRSWLFPGQCWLAVDEGDGRVERRLLALEKGIPFRQMLIWNLRECLKDFHPWLSAYSRPSSSAHTHVQRLSVCFLLLQAYMCANAMLLHFHGDQYSSEVSSIDVSLVSMMTGLCGLALLPLGSLVSCLFRISKTNKNRSWTWGQYKSQLPCVCSVEDSHHVSLLGGSETKSHDLSRQNPSWTQNTRAKTCEQSVQDRKTPDFGHCTKQVDCSTLHRSADPSSAIEVIEENVPDGSDKFQGRRLTCSTFDLQPQTSVKAVSEPHSSFRRWSYHAAWVLWLCSSLACIAITGTLGLRFSSTKSLLWLQSVFFSLLFCVFAVQPAMDLIFAVAVSVWSREQCYFLQCSAVCEPVVEWMKPYRPSEACFCVFSCQQPEVINKHFEKVLAARQRARYLRLVRPPTSAELKCVRRRFKQRTLLHRTIRDLVLHMIALSIVGFLVYGKSSSDQFHLNQALRTLFTWTLHSPLHSIHSPEAWWNWTAHTLLDELYCSSPYPNEMDNTVKTSRGTFYLVGEPMITKMEYTHSSRQMHTVCSPAQILTCPNLDGPLFGISVHLGKNRSEASRTFRRLWVLGWMARHSQAVMIQFTLYSPPCDLFSTVTMLGERTQPGGLLPSVFIRTTRLQDPTTTLDYWLVAAELLFLTRTMLHLCCVASALTQRGRMYWTDVQNWLEVIIVVLGLICFICTVRHFTLREDVIENMQRNDYKTFVDLSLLSFWEQFSRVIYSFLLFILLIKCCFLLHIHEAVDSAVFTLIFTFSNMLWILLAGVILLITFSCLGNLLFHSAPSVLRASTRSIYFIITRSFGVGRLRDLHYLGYTNQASLMLCSFGVLLCVVSVTGRALVVGAISFLVKTATSSKRRKPHVSVSDLVCYIRNITVAGKGSLKRSEDYAHTNSLFLDEFEDLLDELLFHLSVVSDSQDLTVVEQRHQNLLCTARHYSSEVVDLNQTVRMLSREESECTTEDNGLRSRLESKILQRFQQTRGLTRGISSSYEGPLNIGTPPLEMSTRSQTLKPGCSG